ncbi:predicted protein [Postia placenta Mad-698-R]|nr:predicted protein [Postia placenta Mad-698-R]
MFTTWEDADKHATEVEQILDISQACQPELNNFFSARGASTLPSEKETFPAVASAVGSKGTAASSAPIDDEDESILYMVMPFLQLIDSPPFEIPQEVTELVDQLLEDKIEITSKGLVFLHEQGVAHHDCAYKNIMMDASAMYPRGFHPIRENLLPNTQTAAPHYSRIDVPVKYYYVDFGISSHIPPDAENRLVVGVASRDQEVPKLSRRKKPYDPFKVDIFMIGNLFCHYFHDVFSNVEFLEPLIVSMMRHDPALRPSADEALAQWKSIRPVFGGFPVRWRLIPRGALWPKHLFLGIVGLLSTIIHAMYWLTTFGISMQGYSRSELGFCARQHICWAGNHIKQAWSTIGSSTTTHGKPTHFNHFTKRTYFEYLKRLVSSKHLTFSITTIRSAVTKFHIHVTLINDPYSSRCIGQESSRDVDDESDNLDLQRHSSIAASFDPGVDFMRIQLTRLPCDGDLVLELEDGD